MTIYYKCNLKLYQHILAYILCAVICSLLVYIFYHLVAISVILGCLLGIYLEHMYAESTVRKRKRNLRLQFRTFLQSMSVASRAGNTEVHAIEAALKDLRVSYRPDSDIIVEVEHILLEYRNGGVPLKVLFSDLADRSDLEDVRSFASIYSVIEGKNDRIGDILTETAKIIGDKIEIEQEIETTIASAKSETNMMLILPIVIVLAMSFMGGDLLSALFETREGHLAATIALICFALSYVISSKLSDIDV